MQSLVLNELTELNAQIHRQFDVVQLQLIIYRNEPSARIGVQDEIRHIGMQIIGANEAPQLLSRADLVHDEVAMSDKIWSLGLQSLLPKLGLRKGLQVLLDT
ncbi:hypothetical protein D9M68_995620 [compost metagenome]